jgi:hypothetical protein
MCVCVRTYVCMHVIMCVSVCGQMQWTPAPCDDLEENNECVCAQVLFVPC